MMKRIKIFFLVILMIISFNFNCTYIYADDSEDNTTVTSDRIFDVTSKNVILYNLDDKNIIYEKDSNKKVEIASLTKIMTTLVAIENISDLDKDVVITSEVFRGIEEYSQAGLSIGDKVKFKDLLYGVMLPSGADCVRAVILNMGKSNDEFVKLMNDKAKELGLKNTKFDNAIGMDSDDNYSTAGDIAKLLMYALDNEIFKTIYTTKSYTISSINLKLNSTLVSYANRLDTSNILGAKSGFTDGAGLCLSSIAKFNDINYLLVVLGADTSSKSNAVKDSLEIYDYYAKNYGYIRVLKKDQVLKKIDVKWGSIDKYEVKSDKDISVYLKNTVKSDDIDYSYEGIDELTYKNKLGDKLGVVTVKYDGKVLTKFDVYLDEYISYYHPVIYGVMALAVILMIISLKQMKNKKKKKKRKKRKKNKR